MSTNEMQPGALKYDTEFDVKLYVNGTRYWYQLVVNPEKVCSEVLYVYLSNRPTKVFAREDVNGISKLTFNPAAVKLSQAEIDALSVNCLRNMSILTVLKKVNVAVAYLDDMRRWIDSRMMPLINGSDTAISDTTKNMLSEDTTFKEKQVDRVLADRGIAVCVFDTDITRNNPTVRAKFEALCQKYKELLLLLLLKVNTPKVIKPFLMMY